MNVVYDMKDERTFDEIVAALKSMSEQEQQSFTKVFQGIVIGIRLGREEFKTEQENQKL